MNDIFIYETYQSELKIKLKFAGITKNQNSIAHDGDTNFIYNQIYCFYLNFLYFIEVLDKLINRWYTRNIKK